LIGQTQLQRTEVSPDSLIKLPIVCAIDQSYVLPLAVMLESLKHHLRDGFLPVLYLMHSGIPRHSLEAISALVETHSIVPSDAQSSASPSDRKFPREASYLLLLSESLPSTLERVVFLDADMLVLDDLANLWETPMGSHVLAAAPDSTVPRCSSPRGVKGWRKLGIPPGAAYFNAGVLLIDIARWRERDVTQRVRHYFETTSEPIDFLHQEALNAVLWDDWQPLHSRWNLLASLAGRAYEHPPSEAWRQPGVVHFAGRMKPWRAPIGGPFNRPYRKVLDRLRPHFPSEPPSLHDHLCSLYDRYLRTVFFVAEKYLWRLRVI
jgi:lipopolysaccharide biosynthesis glycosyltransferase